MYLTIAAGKHTWFSLWGGRASRYPYSVPMFYTSYSKRSTSFGILWTRQADFSILWWLLRTWTVVNFAMHCSCTIYINTHYHCMHQTCKCDFNCVSLGSYLGCIRLQVSTECEGIKLCASTGCVEPLPGHWVQCCTDGGYEQWWVEKNYLCRRQWRNTGMWTSAAWYFTQLFIKPSNFHLFCYSALY